MHEGFNKKKKKEVVKGALFGAALIAGLGAAESVQAGQNGASMTPEDLKAWAAQDPELQALKKERDAIRAQPQSGSRTQGELEIKDKNGTVVGKVKFDVREDKNGNDSK